MNSTYAPTVRAHASPPCSTNGMAIAAFVLSVMGFFFLSIPFGFVALRQIGRRGEDGRGLAIASLAISTLVFVVIVALGIIGVYQLSKMGVAPETPVSR